MAEFKIKDIENLTGIKAHTLRIWEKRYQILTPSRSDSQIRTYSEEDLVEILNVALLNKRGYKISRIAEMSKHDISNEVKKIYTTESEDVYFEKLLSALISFDEALFSKTLDQLIHSKTMEAAYSDYIITFLERIGILWLSGSIHPGQEHFITNLVRQKLLVEIESLPIPDSKSGSVLLFLPEHEWHEMSLLFYHLVLRKNGIYSFYLGQSTPLVAIEKCIEQFRPVALLTSLVVGVDSDDLTDYFTYLSENHPDLPIYAGGYQAYKNHERLKPLLKSVQSYEDLCDFVTFVRFMLATR